MGCADWFPSVSDDDEDDTDDAEVGFVRTTGKQSLLSKIPIHLFRFFRRLRLGELKIVRNKDWEKQR